MKSLTYKIAGILILFLMMLPHSGQAQYKPLQLDLNYSASGGTGSFRNFIGKNSWSGWQGNLYYSLNNRLSVGLGSGYQNFYQQYPRQMYKLSDGSDLSAVVSNGVQVIPLLLQAKYGFLPGMGRVQPYVALGLGGSLLLSDQYLGEFSNTHNYFSFTARPQAGLFVPFKRGGASGLNVSGSYNWVPYHHDGIDQLNHWSAAVGIRFPLH